MILTNEQKELLCDLLDEYISITNSIKGIEFKRLIENSNDEDSSLDAQMKMNGMMPLSECLKSSQWLEMRRKECSRLKARMLIEGEKHELYEWSIAHDAVFNEVLTNFKTLANKYSR